jgi:hypothetical protein
VAISLALYSLILNENVIFSIFCMKLIVT